MKTKYLFILVILTIVINLSAVFDDYEPSPRARAMGGAYYSLSNDSYAIFYNPAGLQLADNSLGIAYTKLFGLDYATVSVVGLSADLPNNLGSLGIGLQSFDATYKDITLTSEKKYSLSHAITLLKDIHAEIYFGYTANMYHLNIDTFGDETDFGIDVGGLAILHQRTRLGFAVTNLNNPKLGKNNSHNLPQKFAMGISYLPYSDVYTSLELKKTFGGVTEIHAGTEAEVFEILKLRVGIRNQPVSYSMGFGINYLNINVDYGFNTHAVLGGTHHFGIGYSY